MKGKIVNTLKVVKFIDKKNKEFTEGLISGEYFSLTDNKFKLTIHDDGSLDFESIFDNQQITIDEAQRYLSILDDKSARPIKNNQALVTDVKFETTDGQEIYLVVEYVPYSVIGELIKDEEDDSRKKPKVKSKSKLSKLFDLFDDDENEKEDEQEHLVNEVVNQDNKNYLEESFNKMKEEKKIELENKLVKLEENLNKLKAQQTSVQSQVKQCDTEIKLIKDRIKSMGIKVEPNGHYIFISERCNEKIELDDETEKKIKSAISKIDSIDADNFMKLFSVGEYHITIYDEKKKVVKKMSDDLMNICMELGLLISDDHLIYRGESDWHDVLDIFVSHGYKHLTEKPKK